jgi:PAS domain-containing protein
MDQARDLLTDMESEEVRLDHIRERAATRRWAWTAVFLAGGGLCFLALLALMIAQRRIAEVQRRRVEDEQRLLRGVFAGIDDGITLLDKSGRLIYANARAARLTGFPSPQAMLAAPREALAERFEMRGEDGKPFPIGNLPTRVVLGGAPSAEALIRHRADAADPWRLSLVRSTPILDATGAVAQAISVFRDVTAEREAQERQRFLLRAVDQFSSSLDYEQTLAAVARLAVPTLADWCAVDIVEGDQL